MSLPSSVLSATICIVTAWALASTASTTSAQQPDKDGWISLFNGKNLDGWKKSVENPDTFSVKDGIIVADGPRCHLFYDGPVENADFKNFEWKCEIMTKPHANSGMYFHTKYQKADWPKVGYEVQVNNTHSDPKKTGGLYAVRDVLDESPVKDNEWFTQHVIVNGKRIIVKVNGKTTVDYTEPDRPEHLANNPGRHISHGTIALQGHDPDSVIHYRKVLIKPLK